MSAAAETRCQCLAICLVVCQTLANASGAMDFGSVVAWTIPEGEVARVEDAAGTQLWPTAIPYVTNGLVAMYDARWNAGIGRHDGTATVWRDCGPNGWDATQRASSGWAWSDSAYVGATNNGHGFACPHELTAGLWAARTNHTVEIVSLPSRAQRMTLFGGYSAYNQNYEATAGLKFRLYYGGNPDGSGAAWAGSRRTHATVADAGGTSLWLDGVRQSTYGVVGGLGWSATGRMILGGENARPAMSLVGELCCVRVYSRPLSSSELAHNAAIDRIRYRIGQSPSLSASPSLSPSSQPAVLPDAEAEESEIASIELLEAE